MKRILYLDCSSGISGDMTVGALLDLGAGEEALKKALDSLGVEGYHLHFGRKKKCGIDAFDFDVHLHDEGAGGHGHEGHSHEGHSHETHGTPSHVHRNLADILEIISRLDAREGVKNLARRIFVIVAEAEAKAHAVPVEQVHFHEVGAVDSIVDIVATAVCLEELGIDQVIISPLAEGRGYVKCQHGVIPVPVPATANIAAAHGLEFRFTENDGEMVTPTGAAIAAALDSKQSLPKQYRIVKIGIGAGSKDFVNANILRAMIIEPTEQTAEKIKESPRPESGMWVMETNLDDCTGEALGFVMEKLLDAGAADVWYTPAFMKKNRPAYILHVLCCAALMEVLEDLIFAHTTTIGIRRYEVERTVLKREIREVDTKFGRVKVKICDRKGQQYFYPEYESLRQILKHSEVDYQTLYLAAAKAGKSE